MKEITPWGSGFIEANSGAVYGFNSAMLTSYCPDSEDLSGFLENQPVEFCIGGGGVVTAVTLKLQEAAASV